MRCLVALSMLLALTACGSKTKPAPQPDPSEVPTPDPGPRTLVPVDFASLRLGPRVKGPNGVETSSNLVDEHGKTIGKLISYVACPAKIAIPKCIPDQLPAGTVYTYVHTLSIDHPYDPDDESGFGTFETTQPAAGFNNTIGFDEMGMRAALGLDGNIKVQTDAGRLIWQVIAGDGLGGGDSITLFWQSVDPPGKAREAFRWERGGDVMNLKGPFPAPQKATDKRAD